MFYLSLLLNRTQAGALITQHSKNTQNQQLFFLLNVNNNLRAVYVKQEIVIIVHLLVSFASFCSRCNQTRLREGERGRERGRETTTEGERDKERGGERAECVLC